MLSPMGTMSSRLSSPRSGQTSSTRTPNIKLSTTDLKITPPTIPDRTPTGPKQMTGTSLAGTGVETIGNEMFDNECLKLINEYFYGVRIFPGQDPTHVYVGWVTTQYHLHSKEFGQSKVRKVTVSVVDEYNRITSSVDRQSCYMVRTDELYNQVSNDASGKSASQGMFIGCFLDTATGMMTFTCEGKETSYRFMMEPDTKLFPAIFVEATSKEILQIELGRTSTTLPLSAAVLQNSERHVIPQFPPRLKVQCLKPHQWARVPNTSLEVHALKLSDIRGWSMLCEDPISMLALHIPEEDRCIDILELPIIQCQREAVSDFLVALTSKLQPSMLLKLLRKLTVDVSNLSEYTTVALRLLTLHYDRCAKYYGSTSGGSSSDEEKRLTMMLFSNIFDSLSKMDYDPELFGKALPCLTAIGCALPPDYSLSKNYDDEWYGNKSPTDGPYNPQPINTSSVSLNNDLNTIVQKFSEHYHDAWASRKLENGWVYGDQWSDASKFHPRLKPYTMLNDYEKERYKEPVRESLKALLAIGWNIEHSEADVPLSSRNSMRRQSKPSMSGRHPGSLNRFGVKLAQVQTGELRFAYSLLEKLIQYTDRASINMKMQKPSSTFSRRTSFMVCTRDIKFFSKVVLPLVEKYFSTHRNYFIAIGTASNNVGAASLKEKEMVASLFCKLANLLRSRLSAFGADVRITVRCLQVLVKGIDAKSLTKSCPEFIRTSMLTFFNNTADDLGHTIQNLQEGKYSHLRGTHLKTSTSLMYINDVVLPVLTAMFDHLAGCEYGSDLLLDEIQVASYKMVISLYTLGIDNTLTHDRKYLKTELERHRPALGTCLGAFSSTFPVAYLEPHLNKHNQYSLVNRIAAHSLEAQDILVRMESSMPTLEAILSEVDNFVESERHHTDAPHIIDVIMPLLCAYLPVWWQQGPDNVSLTAGNHVTMVTSEHMNQLLKNVLKMIKKNIGNENAPWMTRIAAYTQQIIINSSEELLKDPFLPLAERVKKRTDNLFHKEESLRGFLKSSVDDTSQIESQIQEDWQLLVRDIYAFYPLLIKYVDLQKTHWLRNNIPEAELIYNYVSEIFNIWSKSQYFLREEQNFISANEIDNMILIMPTATRRSAVVSDSSVAGGVGGKMKKMPEYEIMEFVKTQLTLPDKIDPADEMSWQHYLYSKLGNKKDSTEVVPHAGQTPVKPPTVDDVVERIVAMAKVLFGLHMIDHPQLQSKAIYRSVVSTQRKRAVIAF
ncbi:ryanodine receptor-like [Diaphorina citri]|uniref:Ryanodine receptor-like n=1 Tax=Diaphorina citri TaxID=121845 RepID=A0A3Q0IX53_DIACI|nr:ryanodine receptor-like [Diaphorina citri]